MTPRHCTHTLEPVGQMLTCTQCSADFPHRDDCPEPGGQHCRTLCMLAPVLALLATGLDLPPEVLPPPPATTLPEAQRQTMLVDLEEALDAMCQRITDQILHPALQAEGVPGWQQYRIALDTRPLPAQEDT